MKLLYYVRHGESQNNYDHIWGGNSELTKKGIQEAIQAGIEAKARGLKFDLIIVSPLTRTVQTSKYIAAQLNHPLELIQIEEQIVERSFGDLDGKPMGNILCDDFSNYSILDTIEGVETVENIQNRAKLFLDQLKLAEPENILIVGHAAFGRALRRVVNNKPFSDEYTLPFSQIPNAKIFKLY